LKVALAQIEPVFGDGQASYLKHKEFVQKAIEQRASLIVFPEMSLTGYNLKDLTPDYCMNVNHELLRETAKLSMQVDMVFGFPEIDENYYCFISSAYCSKGEILHIHRKIFLPINGMFNDSKDFTPGHSLHTFEAFDFQMGLLICRDMWHEELIVSYVKKGIQCLIIPSNIPLRNIDENGPAIHSFVKRMLQGYADRNSIYTIYVNRVGFEEGSCFYGGSMIVDPFGETIAESPFLKESLQCAELELSSIHRKRKFLHLHRDRKDSIVQEALKGE
jgi:predicted amidohydrolase